MSHTIKISDETYEYITNEAAKNGVEPDVWVEKAISSNSSKAKILLFSDKKVSERARKNAWKKFIGAIDSSKTDNLDKSIPLDKRIKSVFGDAVDKKRKKAGLNAPR
ncbi:MAG: hypothetical protein KF855_17765 [Acidobacteria bacterium]|nr:hypothetical protein [Acidobacteriota bacterium]